MKNKLTQLHAALSNIETKGENTKMMAQCLAFTEQLIMECDAPTEPEVVAEPEVESEN